MSEIAVATAPIWVGLLIDLINDTPAIVRAIEVANLPPLPPEHMEQLQAAMNAAVRTLDAAIEAKFGKDRTTAGDNLEL